MTTTRTDEKNEYEPSKKRKLNPSAQSSKSISTQQFTEKDFLHLSENEHMRYLPNNIKIGHALVRKNENGQDSAHQFKIPEAKGAPQVRPLLNIEAITRYTLPRYKAITPGGTTMYATRYLDLEYGDKEKKEQMQIACFSPTKNGKEPFWGSSDIETPFFREDLSDADDRELKKEIAEIKPVKKVVEY